MNESNSKSDKNLYSSLKILAWKNNPKLYGEECLKIADKKTIRPIPFKNNTHQDKIDTEIARQRELGKPVRLIILKPRQTGISTCIEKHIFHSNRFTGGIAMTVSKDGDSSEHLHTIYQRFYYHLPSSEKKILKTKNTNKKELLFAEPHGGRIMIDTAGKKGAGHSFTIHQLHLSEVPRWPDGCEDTIVGLLNSVSRSSNTIIVIEGVANGMTGWFYDEWQRENSEYAKIFLSWFEHKEYSKELPLPSEKYRAQLTDEELKLIGKFDLTYEQIEWRRYAIKELCRRDVHIFQEQYPSTAEEAFRSFGNSFFNHEVLNRIETSEPMMGKLELYESLSGKQEIQFIPNPQGWLSIWQKPQRGRQYVMGADVAEGIEIEDAPADDRHDYSSADVIDRNTGEQVAQFHARCTPDEFGRQLVMLARWYNMAYVAVENNGGYGQHTLTEMTSQNFPSHRLYRDPQAVNNKLGWETTRRTKKPVCSELDMAIRSNDLFVRSVNSVKEMKSFVVKPNGRIEAGTGRHDDRVISLAIANKMLLVAPFQSDNPMAVTNAIAGNTLMPQRSNAPVSYQHSSIKKRKPITPILNW